MVEDDVQKDQPKGLMYGITCAFFFRLTLVLCVRWDVHRFLGRMGLSACLLVPLLKVTLGLLKCAVFVYCGTVLHWLRHRTRLENSTAF